MSSELAEEKKKSRTLLFVLAGVGALFLAAIIVLLIVVFGGSKGDGGTALPTNSQSASGTPTDSASPTPSGTPSDTPNPTPAPTVTVTAAPPQTPDDGNVHVTSYSISPTTCTHLEKVTVHIKWQSANGLVAYFGVNTTDAQGGGMGWDLPASGTSDHDFPDGYRPYEVTCPDKAGDTQSYTITILGNGSKASKTVILKAK
ncbi:MAG: hypothetical protein ABIR17_09255 [Pseudolysinimonas sp.]|uniref:hypothetical protein n=1 Tax=Pseudolysinimonas sp. TaxID=2680009 RepID=UPI003264B56D